MIRNTLKAVRLSLWANPQAKAGENSKTALRICKILNPILDKSEKIEKKFVFVYFYIVKVNSEISQRNEKQALEN